MDTHTETRARKMEKILHRGLTRMRKLTKRADKDMQAAIDTVTDHLRTQVLPAPHARPLLTQWAMLIGPHPLTPNAVPSKRSTGGLGLPLIVVWLAVVLDTLTL